LFQFSDDDRISFRQRSITSENIIAEKYWVSPGVVNIEIAVGEVTLEEVTLDDRILEETLFNNIGTP
jgi:hypothetical protein